MSSPETFPTVALESALQAFAAASIQDRMCLVYASEVVEIHQHSHNARDLRLKIPITDIEWDRVIGFAIQQTDGRFCYMKQRSPTVFTFGYVASMKEAIAGVQLGAEPDPTPGVDSLVAAAEHEWVKEHFQQPT